jgi:hypothetical protein
MRNFKTFLVVILVIFILQLCYLILAGVHREVDFQTQTTSRSLLRYIPVYNEVDQCAPPVVNTPETRMLFGKYNRKSNQEKISESLCSIRNISKLDRGTLTITCHWR